MALTIIRADATPEDDRIVVGDDRCGGNLDQLPYPLRQR
jgi:hypothetical protein